MTEELSCYVNLFADDAKVIKDENDCKELQNDFDKMELKMKARIQHQKMPCFGNWKKKTIIGLQN